MYLTLEILQKRGACQEALDFFAKHYPDGAELIDLIEKAHLPEDFLHWGFYWLEANDAEKKAYLSKMHITGSVSVLYSKDVFESYSISHSCNVTYSERVKHSKNVTGSKCIYDSNYIDNCEGVWKSFMVSNGDRVLEGKNVTNSKEVIKSSYVQNSSGVFQSENIVNCTAIWKSSNLTDCGFCSNCINLKNSLFCDQQSNGEYLLFNKPIEKTRFDMIYQQYNSLFFKPRLRLMSTTWTGEQPPRIHQDFRKHFSDIDPDFWTWVKTLPNYNPNIMYSLTFDPQFLL